MSVIKPEVLSQARRRVEAQDLAPISPGVMTADGPQLCLAAAMAWAGFASTDKLRADAFAVEAVTTGSKVVVEQAFEALGWGRALCRERMQMNDACEVGQRRAFVLSVLR